MGKNKKRKSASQRLEEIKLLQQQQQQKRQRQQKDEKDEHIEKNNNENNNRDDDDDDDMILIITKNDLNENDNDDDSNLKSPKNPISVKISKRHLEITIQTLQKLTSTSTSSSSSSISSSLIQSSPHCRELRRVLHPLVLEQLQSYNNIDYRIKVTNALSQQQWSMAWTALQACRDLEQYPKQGTIQRWVRDCNDCPMKWKLKLLTCILSLNNNNNDSNHHINQHDPSQALALASATAAAVVSNSSEDGDELILLESWKIPKSNKQKDDGKENDDESTIKVNTTVLPDFPIDDSQKLIIYQEAAAERKPPNKYDLLLHYTPEPIIKLAEQDNDGEINLSIAATTATLGTTTTTSQGQVQKHMIDFLQQPPHITSPFLLENVLSKEECIQFMAAATTLGYRPDHPISMEHSTGIDSCEWLMEDSISKTIFNRVQPYLPPTIQVGGSSTNHSSSSSSTPTFKLHSINPRWRFFRYRQDCVYRPHIDGSWPVSMVRYNPETKKYEYSVASSSSSSSSMPTSSLLNIHPHQSKSNSSNKKHNNKNNHDNEDATATTAMTTSTSSSTSRSYLTFLIYLNDDFTGGETRFYTAQPISLKNDNDKNNNRDTITSTRSNNSINNNDNDDNNPQTVIKMTARGIRPVQGGVLVFPQGNTASLIHEGSAVTQGTKYVVRTDVIYIQE